MKKENKGLLVDTNIIINHARGVDKILENLLKNQDEGVFELYVNNIIVGEYFSGLEMLSIQKFSDAKEMFSLMFTFIETDFDIGAKAGSMVARKTIPFLGDAIIAATCILNELELVTSDFKHFDDIEELKLFDISKL